MTTASGTQTAAGQSKTQPWKPAIPALTGILSNVQGLQGQSGINPIEASAIQQLTQNAGGIQNLAPQYQQQAANYAGGDPFGILNPAYQQYQQSLAPLTNPANLNPMNTPGFSDALKTLNQDITGQINGQFAAAGRSGSGYNDQTLARGLSQGEGGLLANQYNQNVQNLLGAASGLQGAGLGTNSAMSNNVGSGAALASAVPGLATQGPGTLLNAGQVPFNLLTGNQGLLAGLTVPIAGLGGQSSYSGQTNSSYTPSPFQSAISGLGLFGGGNNSAASGFGGFLGRLPGIGGLFGGA